MKLQEAHSEDNDLQKNSIKTICFGERLYHACAVLKLISDKQHVHIRKLQQQEAVAVCRTDEVTLTTPLPAHFWRARSKRANSQAMSRDRACLTTI